MLKKLLLLIVFVCFLFTTGCMDNSWLCDLADAFCGPYEPLTSNYEGQIQNWEVRVLQDATEDFNIDTQSINFFSYEENEGIPYVDIEEFLYLLRDVLEDYTIVDGDTLQISYKVNLSGQLFNFYEYIMIFDPEDNSVYINDMGFSGDFNNMHGFSYDTDLRVVDGEYYEGDLERTIMLEDYDMEIIKEDERFFIPFYLANLFLTGDYINVYNGLDDVLHIVDDFTLVVDELNNQPLGPGVDELNLVKNSANYLALFLDNYYGLAEYFGYPDYEQELRDIGLYDAQTIVEFDEILEDYIYYLDDLHTSIADFGYDSDYVDISYPPENSRTMNFYDVYRNDVCYYRNYEMKFTEYYYYYILELNEFTMETVDLLEENLKAIDPDKPIYIDLACNPGGSLAGVLEVLMYMTDNPVNLRYENMATGEIFVESYQLFESRALDNEFFIFTSSMTFSAANLLTSMAKDNELATIIGTNSSGGACTVLFTVLPNNLLLTHSSLTGMLNEENELIEDGIAVDYVVDYSISLEDTLTYINHLYTNAVDFDFDDLSTTNSFNIFWQVDTLPEGMEFEKYVVEVVNENTDTVLFSEEVTSTSFSFNEDLGDDYHVYTVRVIAFYDYAGMILEETVYTRDWFF